MPGEQVLMWAVLLLGVVIVGEGVQKWRTDGKQKVLLGVMFIAQAAAALGSGWVRYAAWAVLAPIFVHMGRRLFTDRDTSGWWITLPFLLMMIVVAVTEAVFDDINLWQRLAMGAIAVATAAAFATTVARLVQARRMRRSLG